MYSTFPFIIAQLFLTYGENVPLEGDRPDTTARISTGDLPHRLKQIISQN